MQAGLARLREAAEHRLDMVATGLDAELTRFDYLPALLEMTPVVPALLNAPADASLRDAANRWTDNIHEIKKVCVDKFGMERERFEKGFEIGEKDLEYVV